MYRWIARFYGINYQKTEDGDYVFKSRDIISDIMRLFYINHEDDFTANDYNKNVNIVDKLVYHEMEKEAHSQLRIALFRTIFENVPQLILQFSMVSAL